MPMICFMVRENLKTVRETSGKSQGILWGLMAGHPENGTLGLLAFLKWFFGWWGIVITIRAGGRAADLAEPITLKPFDGFTPFEVLWTCLDLNLCNVMANCPFAPGGLAHRPITCQIWYQWSPHFAEPISLKPLDRFSPFKVLWNSHDL